MLQKLKNSNTRFSLRPGGAEAAGLFEFQHKMSAKSELPNPD